MNKVEKREIKKIVRAVYDGELPKQWAVELLRNKIRTPQPHSNNKKGSK